jgi:hypothetical protein
VALFFPTGHRMEVYWEHCRRAGALQEKDWFSLPSASMVHDMHLQLQLQQPKHFKPQRGGGAWPNLLNPSWSKKERVLLHWIAFCDKEAVHASSLAGTQVQPDYTFVSRPGKVEMPISTRICNSLSGCTTNCSQGQLTAQASIANPWWWPKFAEMDDRAALPRLQPAHAAHICHYVEGRCEGLKN